MAIMGKQVLNLFINGLFKVRKIKNKTIKVMKINAYINSPYLRLMFTLR